MLKVDGWINKGNRQISTFKKLKQYILTLYVMICGVIIFLGRSTKNILKLFWNDQLKKPVHKQRNLQK